jgi:hypothetical protein
LISDVEAILRPPEREMPPYPPKYIVLASGDKMVVRQAKREEVPLLLDAIRPLLTVEKDYYDIVAARTYAELLGWKRYRARDEYCLVGLVDGLLVGLVNGRMYDENIGVSYHTLALKRGLRVGAHLFAAKMEYHLEMLGQKEVWITAESPIGFRRWMITWGLELRPGIQHELGGVSTWALTKEIYEQRKSDLVFGERPVPEDLLEKTKEIRIPDEKTVLEWVVGRKEV